MIPSEREIKVGKVVVANTPQGFRVSGEFVDINAFFTVCCVDCSRAAKGVKHDILTRTDNNIYFFRCRKIVGQTNCGSLFLSE